MRQSIQTSPRKKRMGMKMEFSRDWRPFMPAIEMLKLPMARPVVPAWVERKPELVIMPIERLLGMHFVMIEVDTPSMT